uniref:5'-AMP-activated protein kinase subunit gamma-3 (Trinotate prediction) n=1 Tax=Henneguya salminicola TaxID=69463 RepID=A0A6G3MI78_HENSL
MALNTFLDIGERAALLFDHYKKEFLGMFTVTDFLFILNEYYNKNCSSDEVENQSIRYWRDFFGKTNTCFSYILPEDSLLKALQSLCTERIHRLPIIDLYNKNPLGTVSHKKILNYLDQMVNKFMIK